MIVLDDQDKIEIFDKIIEEYIQEHGLGGMLKTDFDAFLLWKIVEKQNEIDSFAISNYFKIKETRVKSLLETAAVKFDTTELLEAWEKILTQLIDVEFDIESLEKGQIRFQLRNPMLYRWLQAEIRELGSTCVYNKFSEQITMNLDVLYKLLDALWEEKKLGEHWRGRVLSQNRVLIRRIIGNIGQKIESNVLEKLKKAKQSKLKDILKHSSELSSVGTLIMPLVNSINN